MFSLPRLKGNPTYILFYTGDCPYCRETLEAVDALVKNNRRAQVLVVDMDALFTDYPEEARLMLDTFDLSSMPFVLQTNRKGVVQHRYVKL